MSRREWKRLKNPNDEEYIIHIILYDKGWKQRVILDTELSDSNYEFQIGSEMKMNTQIWVSFTILKVQIL